MGTPIQIVARRRGTSDHKDFFFALSVVLAALLPAVSETTAVAVVILFLSNAFFHRRCSCGEVAVTFGGGVSDGW